MNVLDATQECSLSDVFAGAFVAVSLLVVSATRARSYLIAPEAVKHLAVLAIGSTLT